MCGGVKWHWFVWLCISFTTGSCPALKPIYKDLSNCLFKVGDRNAAGWDFIHGGWMLAVILLSWWHAIWPETKIVHLISIQQGEKQKTIFQPFEIWNNNSNFQKWKDLDNRINYDVCKASTKISYTLSWDWRINAQTAINLTERFEGPMVPIKPTLKPHTNKAEAHVSVLKNTESFMPAWASSSTY